VETPKEILEAVATAMEVAAAKVVRAAEVVAVVRGAGAVAAAAKATAGTPEVAGAMGEPAAVPAKGLGTAAVEPAAAVVLGASEVAAGAVVALELVIVRVPGPVAVPARAMQAEAMLVPEALGALEAQAVRPATTAAEHREQHRLPHPCPQHQMREVRQVRAQHRLE
jgi:hypothetical protein